MHRTIGRRELWIDEHTIRYDDATPFDVVGITEFRDGTVVRERIHVGEPWDPPTCRARLVETVGVSQGSAWGRDRSKTLGTPAAPGC